jgi:hypothetical protein
MQIERGMLPKIPKTNLANQHPLLFETLAICVVEAALRAEHAISERSGSDRSPVGNQM